MLIRRRATRPWRSKDEDGKIDLMAHAESIDTATCECDGASEHGRNEDAWLLRIMMRGESLVGGIDAYTRCIH